MNILVVDRESGVRRTLAAVLEEESHSVAVAASGAEGLQQALETAPDFVIYDVHMTDLPATAFLPRYHESGGRSPVIITFTYGNVDQAMAGMRQGAYDCLPKPFTTMELVLTLQKSAVREEVRKARGSLWG